MPRQPNMLFVMADQLRRDALGCYGSWAPTPHIDAIADEATIYDNAVTVSPVCIPARHSLALGLYPHNFGLWSNFPGGVAPDTPTWMNDLRAAGYSTSVFGKLHLGGGRDLLRNEVRIQSLGFDVVNEIPGPRGCAVAICHMTNAWDEAGVGALFRDDMARRLAEAPFDPSPSPLPLEFYYDSWIADRAVEHLVGLPRDRPWFCTVSFAGPHSPWDAPEPYASLFDPADAPPPIHGEPQASVEGSSFDELTRWGAMLSPDHVRSLRANYAGAVALIDDQVAKLVAAIRSRGDWENTVVVVTADHGEMNGDHGLFHKNTFLEGAVQIPLIVRVPGGTPRRSTAPVELHDAGRTLAAYGGAEPEREQYAAGLPDLEGLAACRRAVAISEFLGEYMVFDGRHKLVLDGSGETVFLWDRVEDPTENNNVAGHTAYAEVEVVLRDALLRRLAFTQLAQRPGTHHGAFRAQMEWGRDHLRTVQRNR